MILLSPFSKARHAAFNNVKKFKKSLRFVMAIG